MKCLIIYQGDASDAATLGRDVRKPVELGLKASALNPEPQNVITPHLDMGKEGKRYRSALA